MDVSRDGASYRKQAEVYSQDRSDRAGSWVLYRVIQEFRKGQGKGPADCWSIPPMAQGAVGLWEKEVKF